MNALFPMRIAVDLKIPFRVNFFNTETRRHEDSNSFAYCAIILPLLSSSVTSYLRFLRVNFGYNFIDVQES